MNKEKYIAQCGKIKASEQFKRDTAEKMRKAASGGARPKKSRRVLKWVCPPVIAAILVFAFLIYPNFKPETVQAKENLMEDICTPAIGFPKTLDTGYVNAQADFSVKLFQKSITENKNSLISPVSVSLALGMTANGANGETLKEFENLLGGGMDINTLDKNFATGSRA